MRRVIWYKSVSSNFITCNLKQWLWNWFFTLDRFRFPRWRGFWKRDFINSCVIWRDAFKMKFRHCKQTWEQSFWGWPLMCDHDVTFRRSCSGKRLSKPPNVYHSHQSCLLTTVLVCEDWPWYRLKYWRCQMMYCVWKSALIIVFLLSVCWITPSKYSLLIHSKWVD